MRVLTLSLLPRLAHAYTSTLFVTGGTGMVGSHFVQECLESDPTVRVACLVRPGGSGILPAEARLHSLLEQELGMNVDTDRVIAVPGDVTKENLGMSSRDYNHWTRCTDAVVHLAADIRLAGGSRTEKTNLDACRHVLQFAKNGGKSPPLHFMSSIASCGLVPKDFAKESLDHSLEHAFPGGYGAQKWHAEQYLASSAGTTPLYVYRAPFIVNPRHSQTFSVPDLLFQIALVTGMLPESSTYIPMHHLDTITESLSRFVLASLHPNNPTSPDNNNNNDPTVYHLADTRQLSWQDQVATMQQAGLSASVVPWKTYETALRESSHKYASKKLYRALPLLAAIVHARAPTLCTAQVRARYAADGDDLADGNLQSDDYRAAIGRSFESLLGNLAADEDCGMQTIQHSVQTPANLARLMASSET